MPGLQNIVQGRCQWRRTTLRLATVFALLALLTLPVIAADTAGVSDTVAIRQAHLAWTALDKEYDMTTAVAYCTTLYGSDTSGMSRLLEEFKKEESRIPGTATSGEVDTLIGEMRNTTAQFHDETSSVMAKGQGKWDVLESQILDAKDNNPYILEKKNLYWATRTSVQLAAFDTWVLEGQHRLDTLKAEGYDTTKAQRALDVFSSRRPEVQSAFDSRSEISVKSANQLLQPLSQDFIQSLAEVQEQVPDSTRYQFFIDQGYRAVARCDKVNADLIPILLDIGEVETVLKKTKSDLANAQRILNTGSMADTRTPLRLVKQDMADLAQKYRDISTTMDLGEDLTSELNALALRLDNTADQMKDAL